MQDINERYGHPTGDRLLVGIDDRLDTLGEPAAAVSHDQFGLLVPAGCADETVAAVRDLLDRPVVAGGHELLVQCSIGTAEASTGLDAEELLRRAHVAVHSARQSTAAGAVPYTEQLAFQADEHARVAAALRAALVDRHFELHYQPIVALPTGQLASVEALVRWRHPVYGMVGPDAFIPVAERTGLIVELGQRVLLEACTQIADWDALPGDGVPRRVSVNVSARQLTEPGFPDTVADVLARSGLAPQRLTVEVTETAVFGGGTAVAALQELRSLGVRIALDDFGTGHSSLGLLRDCPVDVVKVDKSFVTDITGQGPDSAIVAGLIGITDRLGLTTVAEGVEDQAQADRLYKLGYPLAQGYLFGRPMPAADLIAHLTPLAVG